MRECHNGYWRSKLGVHWLNWSGPGQGKMVGTCEQGIEPMGSIKSRKHFGLPKELLASQAGLLHRASWLVSC